MNQVGPYTLDVGVESRTDIEDPFRVLTEPFRSENMPWRSEEILRFDTIAGENKKYIGQRDEILERFLAGKINGFRVFFNEPNAFLTVYPPKAFKSLGCLWRIIVERNEEHPWPHAVLDRVFAYFGVKFVALSIYEGIEQLDSIPHVSRETFPWDHGRLVSARVR